MSTRTNRTPMTSVVGRCSRSPFLIAILTLILSACVSDDSLQKARIEDIETATSC